MNSDISHILDEWSYEPGQALVRKFIGQDGTEKIQMRIDLGLLQMNAKSRPDGKRPFGKESLLDHYLQKLTEFETDQGTDEGFELDAKACLKLQQEAIQYHHRYICYFQLEEYAAVIEDTERNLDAIDFVTQFASSDEHIWPLRQLSPQLVMLQTRAKAMQAIAKKNHSKAVEIVENGIETLKEFYEDIDKPELFEQSGEAQALEVWLKEIKEQRPLSKRERLERELTTAVQEENYEKAAEVRDKLKNLNAPTE